MILADQTLEKFFQVISYGVAVSALSTLFVSGSIGIFSAIFFLLVIFLAWYLEGSRWQISEKIGVVIIVLLIPLFYLDWRFQLSGFNSRDAFAAGNLSRIILILSSIKLLQKKNDRDWILIYLISFFEILLAAGVGISPLFLAFLLIYLLFAFSSIILFEIRKTSKSVFEKKEKHTFKKSAPDFKSSQIFRLPLTALVILLLISMVAVPLFFALPRVGGAGFGGNLPGLSNMTGFSDSVKLGEIGRLQQSDEIVMRVRVEKADEVQNLRWRGVALDYFENQTWRKSRPQFSEPFTKNERDVFQFDNVKNTDNLITQTIYLEPLETPILFTLARPVALQGNFQIISKDQEGSLLAPRVNVGRISYKVVSDSSLPSVTELKKDDSPYLSTAKRYLQLPDNFDRRIEALTRDIIEKAGAKTRYEQAKAVENYLKNSFGYSLEMKAGGADPLADFLFNVREGHCEYFASALVLMLRTQGIAARVVNGFQSGEYNETADVFVVRQRDAHSWVEVYFPKEKVWIPFDGTPSAGQFEQGTSSSLTSKFNKLLEALETYWIQYVVSYDNNEQRSLFISIRNWLGELRVKLSVWVEAAQASLVEWWKQVRGEKGIGGSVIAILWGIGYLLATIFGVWLLIRLFKKFRQLKLWEKLRALFKRQKETSVVEFYQRMQKVLTKKGFKREDWQTPLEFAFALKMPTAVKITEKYHAVRFGEKNLNSDEAREIEDWLKDLENSEKPATFPLTSPNSR
jgi:transglutaminase-like putative cysteine protease